MKKATKEGIAEIQKKKPIYEDFLKKEFIIYGMVFLLVYALGTAFYFYRQAEALKTSSQVKTDNEVADLISKVSKIIVLPEGELPTVATVSDPKELQGQPFFARAKIGDKVLLYQVARKAFLYDPVANKILEVSSITPDQTNPK